MANYFPKQKRGFYEKNSQLSHVLRNLHGYKVATGDVDPVQLSQARDLYGEDEGKLLGAIITGDREKSVAGSEIQTESKRRHKRRKRYRGKRCRNGRETESKQQCSSPTHQALTKSPCKKLKHSTMSSHTSTSLSILSVYSNSSDSEKPPSDSDGQTLEIPSAIREMFPEDTLYLAESTREHSPELLKGSDDDSGDSDNIGYFQSTGFESSPGDDTHTDMDINPHTDLTRGGMVKEDEEKASSQIPTPSLSTYLCWKCSKVGHLAQDCTVAMPVRAASGRSQTKVKISAELQAQYARCREIRARTGVQCAECGIHSNLACCLECGVVLCDGRGHLATHLSKHPSHTTLYSYKLHRMLKCCKASCETVDIYDLLMCSVCLGKAFSQHYSMITATWSRSGLKVVPNALCCEEHFQWHRMNCSNTAEEPFVSPVSLSLQTGHNGLVSEFFL